MTTKPFDALPEAYEATIDWPKRLANEEPLYRWLFAQVGAGRVLDTACGTGHHAAMFASWGVQVEGADISDPMIRWCQAHYGESADLHWVVRGFDQPAGQPGTFDVAICTGNSLALAADLDMVDRAIRQMLAVVRPSGAVLLHVLNLWRLEDGPCQWQKCRRTHLAQGDSLIVKGIHRAGQRGYVDVVVTSLDPAGPRMQAESIPFWGLEAPDLEQIARAAGARRTECYGSYKRQPYERQTSQDLIVVAIRGPDTQA
jgi:SAM-dependent methyltransferase